MTDLNRATSAKPDVAAFFDKTTTTVSYVVRDPSSNDCAIIDSVLDPGEHARRNPAAAGRQRTAFPQGSHRRSMTAAPERTTPWKR